MSIKNITKYGLEKKLKNIIKDKDTAVQETKRTKSDEDWVIAKRLFNSFGSIIQKAKSDLIEKLIRL